jgi:hypothetical protein
VKRAPVMNEIEYSSMTRKRGVVMAYYYVVVGELIE